MKQEMMDGISWTICKTFAPRSRHIMMPAPYHSVFAGWMLFLIPNQQCKSTKGKKRKQERKETDRFVYSELREKLRD